MSIEEEEGKHGHVYTWSATRTGLNASISCQDGIIYSATRKCESKPGEKFARWLKRHIETCDIETSTTARPTVTTTSETTENIPSTKLLTSTQGTTKMVDATVTKASTGTVSKGYDKTSREAIVSSMTVSTTEVTSRIKTKNPTYFPVKGGSKLEELSKVKFFIVIQLNRLLINQVVLGL